MLVTGKPFIGKLGETLPNMEVKVKEQQETLDNLIRQTIIGSNIFTFKPEESPVQWIHWLDATDQRHSSNGLRNSMSEVERDGKVNKEGEMIGNHSKGGSVSSIMNPGMYGRGLQSAAFKFPDTVVAFAQAAKDLPGWPMVSHKVQLQKCDKCSQEFFSPLNQRRHMRAMHRRPLTEGKEDLRKKRHQLAAFWDKLPPEKACEFLSSKNISLLDLSVASIVETLSAIVQQPGMLASSQSFFQVAAALLDIVQCKTSKFSLRSEELFHILEEASEKNFLCGVNSPSIQRSFFGGERGKFGFETKNLVAILGFLMELSLVKAWIDDKDAEALQFQRELVEEEEAAYKKQTKLQERKRLKKLRQKESKEKERKGIDSSLSEIGGAHADGDGTLPLTAVSTYMLSGSIGQDEEQCFGEDGNLGPSSLDKEVNGIEDSRSFTGQDVVQAAECQMNVAVGSRLSGNSNESLLTEHTVEGFEKGENSFEKRYPDYSNGDCRGSEMTANLAEALTLESPPSFGTGFRVATPRQAQYRERILGFKRPASTSGSSCNSHAVWTRKSPSISSSNSHANISSAVFHGTIATGEDTADEGLPGGLVIGSVTIPLRDAWSSGGRTEEMALASSQAVCSSVDMVSNVTANITTASGRRTSITEAWNLVPAEDSLCYEESSTNDLGADSWASNADVGAPIEAPVGIATFKRGDCKMPGNEESFDGEVLQHQACSLLSLLVERWKVAVSSPGGL